jgi:hypothetical protein
MDKSFGLPSALAVQAMKPARTPSARSAGDPLIGSRPPASTSPASPSTAGTSTSPASPSPSTASPSTVGTSTSPASPFPGDYRDRLAQRMNDTVVRRIFAAGLDLQAALGLIDGHHLSIEHRLTLKICHAADELDHAIRDLRDILFERGPG